MPKAKINVHILTASGSLSAFEERIQNRAQKAIQAIKSKIPLPNVDIIIADNPAGTIPHLGIGATTYSPNLVFISMDPSFKNFDKVLEELVRTLAHELNHSARWEKIGYGKTLLEALISEGLADCFDEEVTKGKPQAWSKALDEAQVKRFLKLAEKEFDNKKYDHMKWFFGSGKFPNWTGYSLGYFLVKKYLEKYPNKKPSNIYALEAKSILKLD